MILFNENTVVQNPFHSGVYPQPHVPPSSGKASISSGLPLPLQLTWGFFTPKCFPMHFGIHVYPSGVTYKPFSDNRVAISAAQKCCHPPRTGPGDIHPGSCWITLLPLALGPITVVTPQAVPSSWCLKGRGCSEHCPRCPCPHPPAAAIGRVPALKNGFSESLFFNLSSPFNGQCFGSEGGTWVCSLVF